MYTNPAYHAPPKLIAPASASGRSRRIMPQMFAKMTFLPNPTTNRCMPRVKSFAVVFRLPICFATSEY